MTIYGEKKLSIQAKKAASRESLIFAAYIVEVCKAIETINQSNITDI